MAANSAPNYLFFLFKKCLFFLFVFCIISHRLGGLAAVFWGCFMGAFSLVGSRSFVFPGRGLGGVPLSAPWWCVLVGSALAAGASRWRLRPSSRCFPVLF